MKKYLIPVLVIFFFASVFPVSGNQANEIADNYSFDTALELSRILDRQFVFSFVSASCSHCQEFKDKILSDPTVREILNRHFILSFVTVDETFKIELPNYGEITNMQLASGLGIKGTPTTYIFYPPNPGLLDEGRGITKFAGSPSDPNSMVNFLEKIVTESFKEDGEEEGSSGPGSYYNYTPSVKAITREDLSFLKETSFQIPVITEKVELTSLPDSQELIINTAENSLEEYSEKIVSETGVKKVFLVKS